MTMPNPFSRRWFLTTTLVLLGAAICIRLGIWQLDRLEQRRAFNAHYLKMRTADPLTLNENPAGWDLIQMEYRAVILTGKYDFENQIALRNQYHILPGGVEQYGYHLLTPLILTDGSAILVDRGWIPAAENEMPLAWRKYDVAGTVTLKGWIRLGHAAPALGGVSDPELSQGQRRLDFWNSVNLERIRQQLPYPLLDVYVQLNPEPGRAEPPFPYQPEYEISEGPHLGYAGQWFTFAAILLVGYPFYLRKHSSHGAK